MLGYSFGRCKLSYMLIFLLIIEQQKRKGVSVKVKIENGEWRMEMVGISEGEGER